MASIDRTAYPRFRGQLTDAELETNFTLSALEEAFVRRHARGDLGRLSLAVILKTRRWLGYFPALTEVPEQIQIHIADSLGLGEQVERLDGLDQSRTLYRYRQAIRTHLGSRPFSHGGREIVIRTVHRAAQVMSDPADLISASVEALVKEGIELPAFSNLDRLIGNLRQSIHEEIYRKIDAALSGTQCQVLEAILDPPAGHHLNAFSRLKETPGPATLNHLRLWIDRLAELDAVLDPRPFLERIPHTKIRQFAAEAKAELRKSIRAETTKIESHNDFLDWIGFGGPVIKSGDPVEQLKQVKYMELIANAVMLHNVVDLTDVLTDMAGEGLPVTRELVARTAPTIREHLRRFGQYDVDMEDLPAPLRPGTLPILGGGS